MSVQQSKTSRDARRAILERLQRNKTGSSRTSQKPKAGPPAEMLDDKQAQFRDRVLASSASLIEVEAMGDAPSMIREKFECLEMKGPIVIGADPELAKLSATAGSGQLEFAKHLSGTGDQIAMSRALAGIAETGSLALISGRDNPVSLNYLPDLHIILLSKADVVATLDDVWPMVRKQFKEAPWPRSINLVTGPSRTADVEQTIQLGAHGPRHLLVLLVGAL